MHVHKTLLPFRGGLIMLSKSFQHFDPIKLVYVLFGCLYEVIWVLCLLCCRHWIKVGVM